MNSIVISWQDGSVSECLSMTEAEALINDRYPDAVYNDCWETDGTNDEGDPMERMLVWPDEETAGIPGMGDDGSHAVASICRIARAV